MQLSVIRKLVQLGAFAFLVYGSVVVGHYAADKMTGFFPALSCAYDAKNADYCSLISLQHQVGHRIGASLGTGQTTLATFMPTLLSLGTFLVLFVILGKTFCGWICPMGFFQEVITLVGQKLRLAGGPLTDTTVNRLRPVKWLALALLVVGMPLMAGLGLIGHELGDPFCKICPSRIMTTLASGDTDQVYADISHPSSLILSVIGMGLFGFVATSGLTVRQPFCRVCPMLALHASFKKVGLPRLTKQASEHCGSCGLCAKACPMDIRETRDAAPGNVTHADCTLCGRCVEFCPDDKTLSLTYGPIPLFTSSKGYMASRVRAQKQWEGKGKRHDA